jgi:hypothetical protein
MPLAQGDNSLFMLTQRILRRFAAVFACLLVGCSEGSSSANPNGLSEEALLKILNAPAEILLLTERCTSPALSPTGMWTPPYRQ